MGIYVRSLCLQHIQLVYLSTTYLIYHMEQANQNTQKAVVLHAYGQTPSYEHFNRPTPSDGQLLIKVEASTINPSDRLRMEGAYFPIQLPSPVGGEGTGKVVEAKGADLQHWVGKRVSFVPADSGTWAEYSVSTPDWTFELDEQVTQISAASGIVNPLTVVGMLSLFKQVEGAKGIIHTAAASSLGRMLNRRCNSLGIPILNIVRREEQAQLLRQEGAKQVVVTKGDWRSSYLVANKDHHFNVVFDALGGGPVLEELIAGLGPSSHVYIYGNLEKKALQVKDAVFQLMKGISITGYGMPMWYGKLSGEQKQEVKKGYCELLKGDLRSHCFKTMNFQQIESALSLSVEKASQGKILLLPN